MGAGAGLVGASPQQLSTRRPNRAGDVQSLVVGFNRTRAGDDDGGGFALLSGIYFVASWRFADTFVRCMGRRTWMMATIGLWLLSTLTGIAFYAYYYL